MKDHRAVQQIFERFLLERKSFIGSLCDLARHESNCDLLEAAGAYHRLQSLVTDDVPGIRTTAVLALGRLASQSIVISNKIISDETLRVLVDLLGLHVDESTTDAAQRREVFAQKRAAAFALRSTAKHGLTHSKVILEAGTVEAAVHILQLHDAETKEGAAWLVDCIVSQGSELAETVVASNALPGLIECLNASEISLKRAAASALGSIAQHNETLAGMVGASGTVPQMTRVLASGEVADVRLLQNVLRALSQLAQGGRDLAAELASTGCLPTIARCLASSDDIVRRFAASTLRDVARYGGNLADLLNSTDQCVPMLVQAVENGKGLDTLPGIMALGYLCQDRPALAESVIAAGGLKALTIVLAHNQEDPAKCAAAWAVGYAGGHSNVHAQAVAESGALLALTGLEVTEGSSADLVAKCTRAACQVIKQLSAMPALDALLRMSVSVHVKSAVLERLAWLLSDDSGRIKTTFVQSGGLQIVQELGEEPDSPFHEVTMRVVSNFPEELVNRYSPAYNRALLEKLATAGAQTMRASTGIGTPGRTETRPELKGSVNGPPAAIIAETLPEIPTTTLSPSLASVSINPTNGALSLSTDDVTTNVLPSST